MTVILKKIKGLVSSLSEISILNFDTQKVFFNKMSAWSSTIKVSDINVIL